MSMKIPSWVGVGAIALALAGVSLAAVQAETGKSSEPPAKTDDRTSVRAPYADVDVEDRNVRVDAPFTGVRVDRDRVRVRAPFVDLDIRR